MHRGFIHIWRKVVDSRSWSRGPLHRALLVTLVVKANWKTGFFMGKTIEAGQLATSAGNLAEELQASRSSVYRALQDLQKDSFITVQNVNNRFTLITLINWHIYQNTNARGEQLTDSQRTTNEHNQINKKLKKQESAHFPQTELLTSPANETSVQGKKTDTTNFDAFWQAFPRKVGKRDALKAWNSLQKQKTLPELSTLLEAIERQGRSKQWQEVKFIPHPSTWLNGERWADGQDETIGRTSQQASRPSWAENMGAVL